MPSFEQEERLRHAALKGRDMPMPDGIQRAVKQQDPLRKKFTHLRQDFMTHDREKVFLPATHRPGRFL
jgi:hypothetical protein